MWIRGRQVGGKTFCWARESYRYSDYEFKAASRDGYGEDWPFSYKDLEPYYDKVESFIGVSGSHEGLEQMPDGKFLPPMNLSCGSLLAKQVIEKKFGWRVMPDRVANLTVPHHGRPACHYCDECQRGCYTASYFNSPSVTLPGRGAHGPLYSGQRRRGEPPGDEDQGRTLGGRPLHRSHQSRPSGGSFAKMVVLAAAALESTRILLNSRPPRFPRGVGNSQRGTRTLPDGPLHGGGCGRHHAVARSRRSASRSGTPAGFLIAKYANTGRHRESGTFLRGYRFDGDASQELYGQAFSIAGFGAGWRRRCAGDSLLFAA